MGSGPAVEQTAVLSGHLNLKMKLYSDIVKPPFVMTVRCGVFTSSLQDLLTPERFTYLCWFMRPSNVQMKQSL
jgi:hypothetical protein